MVPQKVSFKNYLLELISSSYIIFDETVKVPTRSGFGDFVVFVEISKISQDNHYIK